MSTPKVIPNDIEELVRQIVVKQAGHKFMTPEEVLGYYLNLRNLLASANGNALSVSVGFDDESPSTAPGILTTASSRPFSIDNLHAAIGLLPHEVQATIELITQADPTMFHFEEEGIEDTLGHRSLRYDDRKIFCLECGEWTKLITKPHLKKHGMTPDEYKAKWQIDDDCHLVSKEFRDERRIHRKPESSEDPIPPNARLNEKKRIKIENFPAAVETRQAEQQPIPKKRIVQDPAVIAAINTIMVTNVEIPEEYAKKYEGLPSEQLLGIKSLLLDPARIVCLECGNYFKLITKPHLQAHGLDSKSYKDKWNIPAKMSLVAKSIKDQKKEFFVTHKIWESRHLKKKESDEEGSKVGGFVSSAD